MRLRCQETRRPTSDGEVGTPFARDLTLTADPQEIHELIARAWQHLQEVGQRSETDMAQIGEKLPTLGRTRLRPIPLRPMTFFRLRPKKIS